MLDHLTPEKPHRLVFILASWPNTNKQLDVDIVQWLTKRHGNYGNQWVYKRVRGQGRVVGVVLFAQECHSTLFQLAWSDRIPQMFESVDLAFGYKMTIDS